RRRLREQGGTARAASRHDRYARKFPRARRHGLGPADRQQDRAGTVGPTKNEERRTKNGNTERLNAERRSACSSVRVRHSRFFVLCSSSGSAFSCSPVG